MRRSVVMLVAAVAAFASSAAGSATQAWSDTGHSGGHAQLVRDPSGQLVSIGHGTHTPGQQKAKKDPPPVAFSTATGPGCTFVSGTTHYCHAGAYQYVASDGAYMSTPVLAPTVASTDTHSLAELAVESTDKQQIIEIGWRVYRPDGPSPRLFIYHWVDGHGTCYNSGCGFVPSGSTTITPGMTLTPSSTPKQFAIEYFQGNWWYGYDNTWFGYLPGTTWTSFTKTGLVQMFGEVASPSLQPCTDMGNGSIGTSTSAAAVTSIGYFNTTTAVNVARGNVEDPTLYDSQVTSANSFRYGGPGAC